MTAVCLSKEGAPQVRLKRGPWGQAGGTAIHTRPANNNVGQSWDRSQLLWSQRCLVGVYD